MFLIKCFEGRLGALGAYYRVTLYTSSDGLCRELLARASGVRGVGEGLALVEEVLAEHGGCRVVSEDPLILETGDASVRVVAEPDSPLATMMHSRLVARVRERCSAKDTPLNGPGASPP